MYVPDKFLCADWRILDVSLICTWYILDMCLIYPCYVLDVFLMFTLLYIPDVHLICTRYILDISLINTWYILDMCMIYPWYVHGTSLIYAGYIHEDIHLVYTWYILDNTPNKLIFFISCTQSVCGDRLWSALFMLELVDEERKWPDFFYTYLTIQPADGIFALLPIERVLSVHWRIAGKAFIL